MSQVLEHEITQPNEFYKKEISRLLKEIRLKNEQMDNTQSEIEELEEKSAETLKRIDIKIQEIENILM